MSKSKTSKRPKSKKLKLKKLITVRHGDYDDTGKLTARGLAQIHSLTDRLTTILGNINRSAVVVLSSTAIRAVESAEIIAKRLGVKNIQQHEDLINDEFEEETHVHALGIIETVPANIIIVVTHFDAVPGIINAFRKEYFGAGIPRIENRKGTANLLNLKTGKVTLNV